MSCGARWIRGAAVSTLLVACLSAGDSPRELTAWSGRTPRVDGVISPGEWDDAEAFTNNGWISQFSPVVDAHDLSLRGWVKHDATRLYFAFQVTDDVLYGIDTSRWVPPENPKVHELSRRGYPWFGDELELLINAANRWKGEEGAAGDGTSWQMVCNVTKSRLEGVGRGGLLEGEPRSEPRAWNTYQRWILQHAQDCAVKTNPSGKGYSMEWAVSFNPCLEVDTGRYYTPSMGRRAVGLNIALGDLDEPEKGANNFGHFHHEDWFAGAKDLRTQLRQWGTLWITPDRKRPDRH